MNHPYLNNPQLLSLYQRAVKFDSHCVDFCCLTITSVGEVVIRTRRIDLRMAFNRNPIVWCEDNRLMLLWTDSVYWVRSKTEESIHSSGRSTPKPSPWVNMLRVHKRIAFEKNGCYYHTLGATLARFPPVDAVPEAYPVLNNPSVYNPPVDTHRPVARYIPPMPSSKGRYRGNGSYRRPETITVPNYNEPPTRPTSTWASANEDPAVTNTVPGELGVSVDIVDGMYISGGIKYGVITDTGVYVTAVVNGYLNISVNIISTDHLYKQIITGDILNTDVWDEIKRRVREKLSSVIDGEFFVGYHAHLPTGIDRPVDAASFRKHVFKR